MLAGDIMSRDVVTVSPDATIYELATLMVTRTISGVPVVENGDRVIGMVTGADLLHRPELERHEPRHQQWLSRLFRGSERLAHDYVKAFGLRASDVMTSPAITVEETAPIAEVAHLLDEYGIKRVAVIRDGRLTGIVSRTDLVKCILAARHDIASAELDDETIRRRLMDALRQEPWATFPSAKISVENGTVHLRGTADTDEQVKALVIAAQNVAGIGAVANHLHVAPIFPPYDLYGV